MIKQSTKRIRIGITLGDVNGIGAETVLKAVYGSRWPPAYRFILIGNADVLSDQARHFGFPVPLKWHPDEGKAASRKVVVWDPEPGEKLSWKPGRIEEVASRCASAWIRASVDAWRTGILQAIVTAPISKEGFHKAGLHYPGHTELLAELAGRRRFAMMLLNDRLRVVIVTRHMPLKDVARSLTRSLVCEAIELTSEAMPWIGEKRGHIAVCGLNPHAGDGGTLGNEEIEIIDPVIRSLQNAGIKAYGPFPADTVFNQALHGRYNAVVAMYHDQGLAPFKLLAFENGVNLTLGLPFVRTSPDHGTGFDIAGSDTANPSSMIAAIRLAGRLAPRCNPWAGA